MPNCLSDLRPAMNLIKSIFILLTTLYCVTLQADIHTYFNQMRNDPNALYAFFKAMPKGGELHYHLAGGPYPETMLGLAATGEYCLDKKTYAVTKTTASCEGVSSKELVSQPELYAKVVKSWSMKDFIASKDESGHDHFFNGFSKYITLVMNFRPQLLVDVMQRAANQHALYLEIMALPDNARSTQFGTLITSATNNDKKRALLLADKDFQATIDYTVSESDRILDEAYKQLDCNANQKDKACNVAVKLQYYVLREQPLDNVFAQALNGFEAVSRSKGTLVGVNLVQAEDGIISLRDYQKQMEIFQFLHTLYPEVPIALHAGELSPSSVVPKELNAHIFDAIFTGHAQRIGHGVDIAYEDAPQATLEYMAKNHLPVEINLISNLRILNVSGKNHPLRYYLAHHVPVVLSTDDEGVLRTDLTSQYVEAALAHGLDYKTLKQINRNALTYAFLPGKSIWADADKAVLVKECKNINSDSCLTWVKSSEKARLQRTLEQQLMAFEKQY